MATGEHKTLIDAIFDETGRGIQKLTRSSELPSYWISALALAFITLLISFLISLFLGEQYPQKYQVTLFALSMVVVTFMGLAATKLYIGIIYANLQKHILDAMEKEDDIVDLRRWLTSLCNRKKPLLFGLFWTILNSPSFVFLLTLLRREFVGYGTTVIVFIGFLIAGLGIYYGVFRFIPLTIRLSRYQFKLFAADPSSSELIDHLSRMLSVLVYMGAVMAAVGNLVVIFTLFGPEVLTLSGLILVFVLFWGLIIAIFIINQYSLATIITKAKWKTLNGIQSQIEMLQGQENLVDKDAMDAVNRLMDYHDRIKGTRNSALDLRAGLDFLNSLLIPLLAFVLANLVNFEKIAALFLDR